MSVATYTKAGAKVTTAAKLNKDIFGLEVTSGELVRLAYEGFNNDNRDNLAVTKTRGLVRGGGRKPWKQKGTGRARFGSSRNPIWRTGGIVFGPTGEENYTTKINRKAKAKALKEALTLKSNANGVAVIDSLPTSGKTSELAKLAGKLSEKGNVVFVEESVTPELTRAAANIPNVTIVTAGYLNVRRSIDADLLVFTKAGMSALETRFGGAQ